MHSLSDQIERKYVDVIDCDDWEILTDTGWEVMEDVKQTVPYQKWTLVLEDDYTLECADTHIVFDENLSEIFVKDLSINDSVMTQDGPKKVISVTSSEQIENMYDVGVDSENHRFFTNGILSHNSTTAAGYLFWYAMFKPNQTILIAAHKASGAMEIMHRIRYAYEMCPDFIRPGVTSYNKGSIEFDNGSRIIAQATTENTGRGLSISLLYCLDGDTTTVRVRDKMSLEEEDITLAELYAKMANISKVIT